MSELTLDQLHAMTASKEAEKRATQFDTVPTGSYTQICNKVIGQTSEGEYSKYVGRAVLTCSAPLSFTDGNGKSIRAYTSFDVSFEEYVIDPNDSRTFIKVTDKNREEVANYKHDGPFKKWSSIKKALSIPDATMGEVKSALEQYPIKLRVNETYQDSVGEWHNIKTDDDRKTMNVNGYTPRNFVQSVSRA